MCTEKKETCLKYPSKGLGGVRRPFRVARIVTKYIKEREKKDISRQQKCAGGGGGEKRDTFDTSVPVRDNAYHAGRRVHADAREYADIEKRYLKPPPGDAAVRWWRHGRRARANLGTCWSLPTFCSEAAEGAFTRKMPSSIARWDCDIWDNAVAQMGERRDRHHPGREPWGRYKHRDRTRLVNLLGLQFLADYKFAHARDFVCKRLDAKVGCKADSSVKIHTTG